MPCDVLFLIGFALPCGVQMDRGPIGVLTGSGYSLVARDSRAAFQFLFSQAQLHPELEDEDDEEEDDEEEEEGESEEGAESDVRSRAQPSGQQSHQHHRAPLSSSLVERVWSPSARLLAHFPPVLRLPFQLIGTWNSQNGEVNLTKRHGQGEVHYRGVTFLLRPSAPVSSKTAHTLPQRVPVPRFHMALQCEFAMADLSFALASTEADEVPPPPPPPSEETSELEPGAPSPPPPPRRQPS